MARPLTALAVRPARGINRETLLLGFQPPRTTLLAFIPEAPPATMARAIRRLIAPDALVVVPSALSRPAFGEALRPARVLAYVPADVLRFLWFYRDEHDLLALGHASERRLLDDRFLTRKYPGLRTNAGRQAVTRLLRETALMIGVRFPRPDAGRQGPAATTAFLEAGLGLIAALLLLFAAPIAEVAEEGQVLRLCDSWLRERTAHP